MKYRKFGSLDWNVSEIGLGCWQIDGSESTVNTNNIKLSPGDCITVDSLLQPVPFPGNFQITFQTVEDQRRKISKMP